MNNEPNIPGDVQVSVITPTKNRRELLRETIASVQNQSFSAWEHIIIDDGSEDGTEQDVRNLAAADSRIQYFPRTGSVAGANACRNQGLAAARADLIVFLDSDDVLRPTCLQKRTAIMHQNQDVDFVVFAAGIFCKNTGDLPGRYHPMDPGDDLLRFLSHECIWQTTGPIWRKNFLEHLGGFDEELLSMQDLELHVRALSRQPKYLLFKDVDHDIRGHADSTRTSTRHFADTEFFRGAEVARAKLAEILRSQGLLTWSRRRALAGLCFATAERWARFGDAQTAAAVWSKGCRNLGEPWSLWVTGTVALYVVRVLPNEKRIVGRALNKWKGIVRFRQEPKLIPARGSNRNARQDPAHSACISR